MTTHSTAPSSTSTSPDQTASLASFGGTPVSKKFISPVQVRIEDDEIDAAVNVLRSAAIRQGQQCEQFENEFAQISDARHALTTSNGTTALQLAYQSLIQPGDEVLCPGFTFIATASMVIACGATPVLCEIDPDTFNIDVNDAASRITGRTTAIAPVHLYGNPVDIDAVQSLAEKHNLSVIYDAAQAHLAKYKSKGIGRYGNACTYSFYPTKNMTTGEGGMITTNDPEIQQQCILLRDHGMEPGKRYHHVKLGYNFRLNDIAASIGRIQLAKLPERTRVRQQNAALMTKLLSDVAPVQCPSATPQAEHVYHQYTIRLNLERLRCSRDEFAQHLRSEGIGSAVHYPASLTEQPVFRERFPNLPPLPESERAGREVLCLPIHHALTPRQIESVAEAVRKVAAAMQL